MTPTYLKIRRDKLDELWTTTKKNSISKYLAWKIKELQKNKSKNKKVNKANHMKFSISNDKSHDIFGGLEPFFLFSTSQVRKVGQECIDSRGRLTLREKTVSQVRWLGI